MPKRYNSLLIQFINSAEEINVIKNNMAILEENQDILSSQIQKILNFVNLTYIEIHTNWFLP